MLKVFGVVKDRLLKANHNPNVLIKTGTDVVKDRLLKANHNLILPAITG